jgi:hypothetical protein
MGEKRNTYRLLVGKPEGKRPLVNSLFKINRNGLLFALSFEYGDRGDMLLRNVI